MTYIHRIATASPQYKYPQEDILDFMLSTTTDEEYKQKKIMSLVSKKSGIQKRNSVIKDLHHYFLEGEVPNINNRMSLFEKEALPLGVEVIKKCLKPEEFSEITHLITVSCTGLSAPGLEISLMKALDLSPSLTRTSVNFMGCYAAFHALRMGDQICKSTPNAKVLIVDIELCSIHFQNEKDDDNIMANTIFADGAAAVYMSSQKEEESLYEIGSFFSRLLDNSEKDMAWKLSETGFQMRLSTYIPTIIEKEIGSLLSNVVDETKIAKDDFQWAFHPGGVRILDSISKTLDIPKEDLKTSYEVLKRNGNMSSVSILFVLLELSKTLKKGPIFSAGFGPGLTMEAMTLELL